MSEQQSEFVIHFVVGKYYETIGGKKMKCINTNGLQLDYPVVLSDEIGRSYTVTHKGDYLVDSIGSDNRSVKGPWPEPREEKPCPPFVVGKYYKRHDGQCARCLAIDGCHPAWPIIWVDEHGEPYTTDVKGRWKASSHDNCSIAGPWDDKPVVDWTKMPAWAQCVFYHPLSKHWWHSNELVKADKESKSWSHDIFAIIGLIPPGFIPIFHGDWTESLAIRPPN